MELPKGFRIVSDDKMKPGTIELRSGTKMVARIENIQCPVIIEALKRGRSRIKHSTGPERTVKRLLPNVSLGLIFVPNLSCKEVEKFHVLSTLEYCEGRVVKAADILEIAPKTLYNKLRDWK